MGLVYCASQSAGWIRFELTITCINGMRFSNGLTFYIFPIAISAKSVNTALGSYCLYLKAITPRVIANTIKLGWPGIKAKHNSSAIKYISEHPVRSYFRPSIASCALLWHPDQSQSHIIKCIVATRFVLLSGLA